jgi:hypothetical protein
VITCDGLIPPALPQFEVQAPPEVSNQAAVGMPLAVIVALISAVVCVIVFAAAPEIDGAAAKAVFAPKTTLKTRANIATIINFLLMFFIIFFIN